ncbi:FAD-dependent oxidoreductase [Falsiroseomonas oryzae]|uniref:FAD-dependent oxidoreductase n=1 Tax=Falsiroseomonas oryzae TaxID=2766473 RepID=UPI0022EB6439|nr:FAD-dependent oxidoreductase [Roseomonas sp. MO-31]
MDKALGSVEYRRQVPVIDEVEVLVVGGGPAGLGAAIAAARGGARTLLIERYGFLGGNMTAGLVGPCMTAYSLDGSQQLIGGIFDEFVRRMEAIGGALHPSGIEGGSAWSGFIAYGHERVTPFDPEAAKTVAIRMCREAGVEVLFHSFVADALTVRGDGGRPRLDSVITTGKGGLAAIRAQVTVDCSADGDVAARAGARFEIGREGDGLMQPMTLFFRVSHVDDAVVEEYVRTHPEDYRPFASLVARAQKEGRFPAPRRGVGLYKTLEPGVWRINTSRILKRDGTSTADLTAAEIEGREQVMALLEFFRRDLPGFQDCRLMDTATQIGVRETRRILGEYTLTLGDLKNGRRFEDVIALCGYPVDIHDPTGAGGGVTPDLQVANAYEIPFRVMVPQDIDGLLVAGRAVSATHEALAAIRVMPPCFAMGQAAGSAAAMAVARGIAPRTVSIPELHARLRADGAILGTAAPA